MSDNFMWATRNLNYKLPISNSLNIYYYWFLLKICFTESPEGFMSLV
jgi:hypothetical protein